MAKKILIVDDSALVRKQLGSLLEEQGYDIDYAKNGAVAVEKANNEDFNVITMDINMPVMDGLTAVKEIMASNPTPIVMVSSLTTEDAEPTMIALENGAIDYVAKPGTMKLDLKTNAQSIIQMVKSASRIPKRRLIRQMEMTQKRKRVGIVPRKKEKATPSDVAKAAESVLMIGSSTGGPGLLDEICATLPEDYPHAVCLVQHMPEKFTSSFATRLNKSSRLPVLEAKNGDELKAGVVYLAKGGQHMHFRKKVSGKIIIRLVDNTTKRFFTPSVDEMFLSALDVFSPRKMMAVILTGIGDDGAEGMVALKNAGVHTLGESEETATVYGMPKEAYLRGGISEKLPFPKIVAKVKTYR